MTELTSGDKAPAFTLPLSDGSAFSLTDAKGPVVLYFYPKDNTKGCTTEAIAFTALAEKFGEKGTTVIGVSPDSLKSHEKFQAKHNLTVLLGSDEDHSVAEAFGVWKEKSMYGKKYMGIERSTFIISQDGTVTHVWRKVKVDGHAEAVLAALG